VVAAGAAAVVVVGGDGARMAQLGLEFLPDRWPGEGPLGGLVTALEWSPEEVVVVAGCDQPWLDAASVGRLVEALDGEDAADAALPVAGGRPQPLPGAYRRRSAAGRQAAFDAGERALAAGLERVVAVAGLDQARLRDVDSSDDLDLGIQCNAEPAPTGGGVEVPEVDIDEMARRRDGGAPVIDVRQPHEYVEAHVPGARLVPLAEVPERLDEVPADGPVLVICHSGGRSLKAAEFLRGRGVDAVNVAGGTTAWIESGRPTVTGESPQ
jgi:rhodanese-related sulfurtransferase/molybdopterin-guanine dinucleotide biosynthesis protein A